MQNLDNDLWKGTVAGLVAGLAATYVMTKFQILAAKLGETAGRAQQEEEDQNSTVKAASAISTKVFHHELKQREKEKAGLAVHYGMGAFSGGLYGAVAELEPEVTRGAGLPFGAAVWLAADEVAVPALGLADPPFEHPLPVHAQALAAHLVYGFATEMVRLQVRKIL